MSPIELPRSEGRATFGAPVMPANDSVESFLQKVERKNLTEIHKRLLLACRAPDPATEIEAEFSRIVLELLHET